MRKKFLVSLMILITLLSACHEIENNTQNTYKMVEIKSVELSMVDHSVFFVGEVHIKNTPLDELDFGILIFDIPVSPDNDLLIENYVYHSTEVIIENNQIWFNWTQISEDFFSQNLYAVFYIKPNQTTVFYSSIFEFNLYSISLENDSEFASYIVRYETHVFLDSLEIVVDFKNYVITNIEHANSHTIVTDYNKIQIRVYLNENVVLNTNFSITINQKSVNFTYNIIDHSIYIQIDDPNWTPAY